MGCFKGVLGGLGGFGRVSGVFFGEFRGVL